MKNMKKLLKTTLFFYLVSISLLSYSENIEKLNIKTSHGNIVIEIYPEKAPITVKNFLNYVDQGFYDGTIFHRIIDGFMIQGGGFDKMMTEKETDAPIKNEANNGLKNAPYTIAMARTSDPDSASSQFFINVANNSFLDYPGQDGAGYCVFGKVIDGVGTVIKMGKLATTTRSGMSDVPIKRVTIKSITKLN